MIGMIAPLSFLLRLGCFLPFSSNRASHDFSFDVLTATAADLKSWQEEGKLSSKQIVERYLAQIEANNDYLHAVISTAPRRKIILRAVVLDIKRWAGLPLKPLHGIPVLIKDNIDTHPSLGMPTTAGTFALQKAKAERNAPLVDQLIKAGAIIIGKANLSELSNYRGSQMPNGWSAVGGLTQSPYVIGGKQWDDGYGGHSAVGGSSSGSCAGVAAGFAPVSIGTDTNASIMVPATRNSVYAMKPTLKLVSQQGICPISKDFDSAGPIARCAYDIAVMMDVIVNPQMRKGASSYTSHVTGSFEGLRIGVLNPKDWHLNPTMCRPNKSFDDQVDREVADAYEKLKYLAPVVKEVSLPSTKELDVDGMNQITKVMDSQFRTTMDKYLESLAFSEVRNLEEMMAFMNSHHEKEFPRESPNMNRLQTALDFQIPDEEYHRALDDVRDFGRQRSIDKCLKENDVNIILGRADSKINNYYVSAGYPMAVVPLGYAEFNGRPFGLCAIAKANHEGLLIRFMSAWEKHFNTERRLPTWIGGNPHPERHDEKPKFVVKSEL